MSAKTWAILPLLLLASPIGLWVAGSGPDLGKIEIAPCGASLCGRLVDAARLHVDPGQTDVRNPNPVLRGRPLRGLMVFKGFAGGPPVWTGEAYDPKTGYRAERAQLRLLSPEHLSIKGCIAVFCRSEVLTRER